MSLAGNLLSASKGQAAQTILVTSSRRGEGRTTAAAALAHGLAQGASGPVLLVDASFSSPDLHKLFGVTASPGLVEALGDVSVLTQAIRLTKDPKVRLLPLGDNAAITEAWAASFANLLASLKEEYEYIVVDGTPALASSEAAAVAKYFDGVALVVECARTKWEVLNLARDKIRSVDGKILGVVMNKRRFYVPRIFYR